MRMQLLERVKAEMQQHDAAWDQAFYRGYEFARTNRDERTGKLRAYSPHEQTGDMPLSITLDYRRPVYRWHDPKYFWGGPQFFKSFLDGSWKLAARGRFAGRFVNCGHYFGL